MLTRAELMLLFGGAAASCAAGPPSQADSDPACAECDCEGSEVAIGYDLNMPFQQEEPPLRARQLLQRAFPSPCFKLSFRSYPREALVGAVSSRVIDLALLSLPPQFDEGAPATTLPEFTNRSVETVPIVPAGYVVVTKPKETESARVSEVWKSIPWKWLALPIGGILGVLCLSGAALAMNHHVPKFRMERLPDGSQRPMFSTMTRIDARLTRLERTWHWVLKTPNGRVLAVLWVVFGVCLTLLILHREVVLNSAVSTAEERFEGALLAARETDLPYELRGEGWRPCDRPMECLVSYQEGHAHALAGDRERLCHLAGELGSIRLEFDHSTAVPILDAYIRPSGLTGPALTERELMLRRRLDEALRGLRGPLNPWESCP